MKYIPNIISLSRIIILFVLFFTYHNEWLFLILYLICGLSDVLDGYIARKTNTQSEFGARLDSLADILLFTVITVFIIQWMVNKILIFLPLIIITALIRCASLAIAAYKYHSFASLHTWGNKLTGFLLFITPLFILFQLSALLWVVCLIAVLSAAEECIIHITSPKVDLNRRSIFKI
ncbi:CDP-alcohol phosphatidyltransferase family protein [Paenibacillus monticola]|uniref:Phosphatidylglycerophosphate synthase n=1 Tax=Paenibacillus monticola TaxID=2666075 RepID=A0A7X2H682_9BACL|nr:CDP-alcohol phosphatidyltransferase family protein [Paenibacillus monticola]MRN53538.1 CDP-alcohol phosphatidyltransferase [Paenibacillus monticola]